MASSTATTADVADLPAGWVAARISDLVEIKYGKGLVEKRRVVGKVPVYGSNGVVGRHNTPLTRGSTIIIGRKGTVGAVHLCPQSCWPIDTTYFIEDIGELDFKFLAHALRSLNLAELDTSSAIPGVNRDDIYAQIVFLPPLAEQKRIVEKVESLLARVNAAREHLAKVSTILKRFRQSVLAATCSGQLTANWRDISASSSTGAELLEKISRDRQAVQAQSRRSARRRDDDEEGSGGAAPVMWEVPDTWAWAKISELLHYERSAAYGVLQPGKDLPDGVPFVRVCDLVNGSVDASQIKRIDPAIDRQYPRTRLQGAEVLVTLVGTIGRIAVVQKELKGANVARAIGMLPLCPHVLPQYLRFALDSPAKNVELVDLAREVARKTLNLGLLKAVVVPLPPLDEQCEIVRRVEALFNLADSVEKRVAAATKRTEKLTQSILAKAFRGELVPTEAELARKEGRDYEPASVLLERIRAARQAQAKPERKSGRKKMPRGSHKAAETKKWPLVDVLRDAGKRLTPDDLFSRAGFDKEEADDVDRFYEGLRAAVQAGHIREHRPNKRDVFLEATGS